MTIGLDRANRAGAIDTGCMSIGRERSAPLPSEDRVRRIRMRTLLIVAVLVPTLGLGGLAGVVVAGRWANRQASTALAADAGRLDRVVDVRDAIADEEIHSTLAALAIDLGSSLDDPDGMDASAEHNALRAARVRVDQALASPAGAPLRPSVAGLSAVRRSIDDGTATYDDVNAVFLGLDGQAEAQVLDQLDHIERTANRRPLSAELRARLRAVRETVSLFSSSGDRIRAALDITLGSRDRTVATGLLDATTRFEAAAERAGPFLGPRAEVAWDVFRNDPAAVSTEQTIGSAVRIGLGVPAATPTDVGAPALVDMIGDGARWAVLLNDVVSASSSDLEAAARDQAHDDTRNVVVAAAVASLLAAVSLGIALLIARELVRPARDLEEAARRVASGDFDLPSIAQRGPRELTATVGAFNDMAATLAAVEERAVALADDLESPVLTDSLPGRTGEALQLAMDRLRASIQLAEQQRQDLTELATRDGLTGLLNRAAALDAVGRELARARREEQALLALFIDLDGLKQLNDAHGHGVGDQALRQVADALVSTTREADIVARLGGDEFVVVGPVPDDGTVGVEAITDRILAAVRARDVVLPDGSIPLHCSIGIAVSGPEVDSVGSLIHAADTALYEAKRAGGDRAAWGRPAPQPT